MYRKIKDNVAEELGLQPLQVVVHNGNFEEAVKKFKTLVQNEGILALYKLKQAYEKPAEKKRRKRREALERQLLQASREALIASGEWEKRQKKKEQKRQMKLAERRRNQEQSSE